MKRLETNLIIGKTFGILIPIEELEIRKNGAGQNVRRFKCKCECGNECEKTLGCLTHGKGNQSCGCMLSELLAKSGLNRKTHRMTNTIFFKKWQGMHRRCFNKNDKHYQNYGGRGITIYDRWMKFENFKEDMYESYNGHLELYGAKDTTLDRIDVNGNYCKDNCRRATQKEQGNNKTTSRYITREGKTQTIQQWSEEKGISTTAISDRINTLGLCDDVFKNNNRKYHMIEWNGKTQNITQRAKELGIKKGCLEKRIRCYTNMDKIMYQGNYNTQGNPL